MDRTRSLAVDSYQHGSGLSDSTDDIEFLAGDVVIKVSRNVREVGHLFGRSYGCDIEGQEWDSSGGSTRHVTKLLYQEQVQYCQL